MKLSKIAVIAHNKMKPLMVEFLKEREDWLWGREILATGLTADFVEQEGFKVKVTHLNPGKEGGYSQLRELVSNGNVSMVIFFRDPEIVQDYEQEVTEFLKECNRQNIPLATNPSSAELIILGLIKMEASEKIRNRAGQV
ncbi:MAG: methylglyoxal synthase [Cryomorphaceae bacterium]|nr:methylglyoxal synthase [Cryomorphaceae bacterium]